MDIINLDTGQIDNVERPESLPVSPAEIQAQQPGQIINLDTGTLEEFKAPEIVAGGGDVKISPFPEQRGETRAAKELPELGEGGLLSGENRLKIAAIIPLIETTTNNSELADILVSTFPESLGKQFDPGGNELLFNNKTGAQIIVNKPGFSRLDLIQGLGIASLFTPAARGATLAGGAIKAAGIGGKTALAGTAVSGAITSGLTQAALEGIQSQLGGTFDDLEIALAASLGGAAELVIPAIQAVRQVREARKIGTRRSDFEAAKESIKPAQKAVEGLKAATGKDVGLFKAQQTSLPSDMLKQRVLPQLDAGSQRAAAALEGQNKEAFDATSELINTIAGPEVTVSGSKQFRTASQKAIDSIKERRSIAVNPMYRDALEEGADVNISTTNSMIDNFLSEAPKGSDFEKVGNKLMALLEPIREGEKPSLRQLQKAKMSMQDIIDGVGDKSVSGPIKAEVVLIKRELVNKMSEASPLFRAAEDKFIELTPAVKEVEDSLIGAASKVKDIDLENISRRIFSKNSNPAVVKNAKTLIDKVDPDAWNNMLRSELQRRFGGMEAAAVSGEIAGNVPGQLRRSIFGNPEQKRTLLAAMSPDQAKNFTYLDEVLRRAASGRAEGSPTAAFGQAIERLRGVSGVIRDTILQHLILTEQ